MRLLLIEDDPLIGKATQRFLATDGHAVDWVERGSDALLSIRTHGYACILLDLGLPDMDGHELLKQIRGKGCNTPLLILTAREAIAERVHNLDQGADDFIVKPFDLQEVSARIRVATRRAAGRAESRIQVGEVSLLPDRKSVLLRGQPVPLTGREYTILYVLMSSPAQVLTRAQIEEALYGWGEEVDSNSIEVHIHNLRRKLGKGMIKTVRGLGYRIGEVVGQ